jgi:hypothetical protein
MFELVPARMIVAVLTVIVAFCGGWYINGVRWERTLLEVRDTQAQIQANAQEAARKRERAMAEEADALRKVKDDEIRRINGRLAAALVELRDRPPRPEYSLTPSTGVKSPALGSTGAQLYREDAEFLAREAARADEIRVSLIQCIAQYDEVTGRGRR